MAIYWGSVTNNTNYFGVYINIYEIANSVNIAENTSRVGIEFHITRSNWGWISDRNFGGNVVIDGTTYSFSYTPKWASGSSGDVTIACFEKTVKHNDNGAKWCDVSAIWWTDGTFSCGTASASGGISLTTIQRYVSLINVPNFNLGDSETIQYSNPGGVAMQCALYGNNDYEELACYRSCLGSSYTFDFTDEELDRIYKAMGTSNSMTCRIYLKGNNNWDYKTVVITLTGNQKTGHINILDSWYRTKKWLNIASVWKRCVRWVKVDGIWKRCI